MATNWLFTTLRNQRGPARRSESEEKALLAQIARLVGSSLQMDEVYGGLGPLVRRLIPSSRMSVRLVDLEKGTFTEAFVSGLDIPRRRAGETNELQGTVAGAAVRTRSVVLVGDEPTDITLGRYPSLRPVLDAGIRSVLAVPLIARNETLGALMLASIKLRAYSERHLQLAEMVGDQLANAIANSQVHRTLQREADEQRALAEIGQLV